MIAVIATAVLLLSLWAAFTRWAGGPIPVIMLIDKVCFSAHVTSLSTVLYFNSDQGCLGSSSCTRRWPISDSSRADAINHSLHFTGVWLIRNLDFPRGTHGCTADCGGPGSVEKVLPALDPGQYDVYVNNAHVGKLVVPLPATESAQPQCFSKGSFVEMVAPESPPTLRPQPSAAYPVATDPPLPTVAYP
jgi:hypothetical protein